MEFKEADILPVIFMERSLLDSLTEADIKEIIDENEGTPSMPGWRGTIRASTTSSGIRKGQHRPK